MCHFCLRGFLAGDHFFFLGLFLLKFVVLFLSISELDHDHHQLVLDGQSCQCPFRQDQSLSSRNRMCPSNSNMGSLEGFVHGNVSCGGFRIIVLLNGDDIESNTRRYSGSRTVLSLVVFVTWRSSFGPALSNWSHPTPLDPSVNISAPTVEKTCVRQWKIVGNRESLSILLTTIFQLSINIPQITTRIPINIS